MGQYVPPPMASAPEIESLLDKMGQNMPRRDERSLIAQGDGSLTVSLMKEAWEQSDHSPDDPGEVEQWHFPQRGLVVINLEGSDE